MKKNIARIIALALVAVMACALLAACAAAKPSGTYKWKEFKGQTVEEYMTSSIPSGYTLDEALAEAGMTREDMYNMMTITFNDDGTGRMKLYDQVTDFTWKMDGSKVTLIAEMDGKTKSLTASVTSNTITIEKDGETMVFGK